MGVRHQLNTENILACIALQIIMHGGSTHLPEPVIQLYKSHYQTTEGPTEAQCVELITNLSAQLSVLTVVLDGVDECPLAVQSELLLGLQQVCDALRAPAKIFISSRDEKLVLTLPLLANAV